MMTILSLINLNQGREGHYDDDFLLQKDGKWHDIK